MIDGTAAVAEWHVKTIGAEAPRQDQGPKTQACHQSTGEVDANGLPRYAVGSETIVLPRWAELVIVKFDMSLQLS